MPDEKNSHRLWYTRRDGVVKGPFPEPLVSSYILLGRLNEKDELSPDGEHWGPLSRYPELFPEEMKNVRTEEDRMRLELARMRVDERLAEKRLEQERARARAAADAEWDGVERRGTDRRRPEPESTLRHRAHRRQLLEEMGGKIHREQNPWVLPAILVLILLGLVLVFWLLWTHYGAVDGAQPDCSAPPAPGVNWSFCHMEGRDLSRANLQGANLSNIRLQGANLHGANLSGADLSYAELNRADLGFANLQGARLQGAVLVGANLAGADLSGADLAYASLQDAVLAGARLERANLSKAYWTNGRVCRTGSISRCR
ncbi:MAG: pentapeptide repeat-containing protein [Gammaproteobacteria bacterium]|nr:MAG: pentapeptide repeat-containing protein [Gammaproteobacteria bacterium]